MQFISNNNIDVYSICESVYYTANNDEYDYIVECIDDWINNGYNDEVLIESIVLNEITNDWIEKKLNYHILRSGEKNTFRKRPNEKKTDLILALRNKNDIHRNERTLPGMYNPDFKKKIDSELHNAIYTYRGQHNLPDARTRNRTTNKRIEIAGLGKRRLSQLNRELSDHLDREESKTDNLYNGVQDELLKAHVQAGSIVDSQTAKNRFKQVTGQDYDSNSHYHVHAMKNIYSALYQEERERIQRELSNPESLKGPLDNVSRPDKKDNTPIDTKPMIKKEENRNGMLSRGINWMKNNKGKTALGIGLGAAAIGGGIYAYKQYKNKPRSVIAKRIAALRGIYRKFMLNAQRNPQKANIFKRIAAKILNVIDKLMEYLQHATDRR